MTCPVCNRDTEIRVRSTVYSDVFKREYEVRECTVCRTKECHPQLTDADLKEYYTDEEIVGEGKYEKWKGKYRYIYEWISKHMPEKGRVIEIGCNSGNQLRYFKEQGWTPYGLEFSEACQEYARNTNDIDVSGETLDELHTRAPDQKFDLAVLVHTFEHLTDPRGILAETKRILAPGGHLFIEVPNGDMLSYDLLMGYENPLRYPFHSYMYTLDSLQDLLTQCGFEIVAARPYSLKEDGGQLSGDIARWIRHRTVGSFGDNPFSHAIAWIGKRIVRFFPCRAILTRLAARKGKSTSFAVLCQRTGQH